VKEGVVAGGAVSGGRVIRLGLALTGVLAVPAFAVAAGTGGGAGVVAAALGLVVVVAFFSVSKIVVGAVARRSPAMLLPAAMGTYLAKIALLGVLLLVLRDVEAIDLVTFAWTIFVGVFVWLAAEIWVATHTRVPFFDPEAFRAREREQRG
jgi:ATP synthase protein I